MKEHISDLAIFGNSPAFQEKIYVGRPNIGDRSSLFCRINEILDEKWLTNDGSKVKEFERKISDYLGVKNCIVVCNATIALELSIRALGVTDEVIIPSYTFIATAHSLRWLNIKPVFCDIRESDHNIDPTHIERLITPKTSGMIGVHLWGNPCDADVLEELAVKYKLKLIFDAAHAFGCSKNGKMIGNYGDLEVFSFHATKFLNSLEGGAIVTNNDSLAAKLRLMRNFGFAGYDNVVLLGTNGKMNEFQAAMGLTSLESLDEFVEINYRNYVEYSVHIEEIKGLKLLAFDQNEKRNYQYIVVEMCLDEISISRDDLIEILWSENVIARKYFYPGCHRMEPYKSDSSAARECLPITEKIAERVIVLPTGTSITPSEIRIICSIIETAVNNSQKVSERLRELKSGLVK